MRRKLFTILAALSLLLCLATVALWVRSYWHCDSLIRRSGGVTTIDMLTLRGSVQLCFGKMWTDVIYPDGWACSSGDVFDWNYPKFQVRHVNTSGPYSGADAWRIISPAWLLCVVFAIVPTHWLVMRHRAKRGREACCVTCGYDLRATPDRCPECGTMPETMKSER